MPLRIVLIDWVQSLLHLHDHVLEVGYRYEAIDVQLVSVHKALHQQSQVCVLVLLFILTLLAHFFLLLHDLCLDSVWNYLGLFVEHIHC